MDNRNEIIKVLLSVRQHRNVHFNDALLFDVYNAFFEDITNLKPELVVCNSLQNRTSFSLLADYGRCSIVTLSILKCAI